MCSRGGRDSRGHPGEGEAARDLSTLTTKVGTKFTAEVTEPVMRDGVVIVPVGSVLDGRVTWVRGGKRIGGAAAIHLEPRTITCPTGQDFLRARVIDTTAGTRPRSTTKGRSAAGYQQKDHRGDVAAVAGHWLPVR